jgi:hypothetical protein
MAFYVNLGYKFTLPNKSGTELMPDGCIILASAMPAHQLERRKDLSIKYPHMRRRLFDPQLYLAELDANQSPTPCAKLASYPWFGVNRLSEYISSQQNQKQWMTLAEKKISEFWPRKTPEDPTFIRHVVADCIEFQRRLGCRAVILPSPLTTDPNTNYEIELFWLDVGLEYVKQSGIDLPVIATIALADICLYYTDPRNNNLLEMIVDVISARGVGGVYIVLEQGREPTETRQCSSTRALHSILHLVHIFSHDANLWVAVNFLGQFGLACEAAGAKIWASEWYKSLYRLRLPDKIGGGPARPSYWSYYAAVDVNLRSDYDRLNKAGIIAKLADHTDASTGLLFSTRGGQKCETVPEWAYRPNNVQLAREHFLRSSIEAERMLLGCEEEQRLDFVEDWLQRAAQLTAEIEAVLGNDRQTSTIHVQVWLDAFRRYRADHKV